MACWQYARSKAGSGVQIVQVGGDGSLTFDPLKKTKNVALHDSNAGTGHSRNIESIHACTIFLAFIH
jgi:hypothetical protein